MLMTEWLQALRLMRNGCWKKERWFLLTKINNGGKKKPESGNGIGGRFEAMSGEEMER